MPFNPAGAGLEGLCSLFYLLGSRLVRAMKRDLVSQNKNKASRHSGVRLHYLPSSHPAILYAPSLNACFLPQVLALVPLLEHSPTPPHHPSYVDFSPSMLSATFSLPSPLHPPLIFRTLLCTALLAFRHLDFLLCSAFSTGPTGLSNEPKVTVLGPNQCLRVGSRDARASSPGIPRP